MPEQGALTYADLFAFPDDGLRRELLDGELIVSPSPLTRHQRLVSYLHGMIWTHLRAHPGGEVFVAPMDVVLSDSTVVEPDVFVLSAEQADLATRTNIQGPPALVIEVMSNARIDRVRKRDVYGRFGVAEYWIVDPDADRVEVYRLSGDRYDRPEVLEPGDTVTCALLEGFCLDVTELFAR